LDSPARCPAWSLIHASTALASRRCFSATTIEACRTELVKAAHDRRRFLLPDLLAVILPDLIRADHRGDLIWQFTQIWNDFLFGSSFTSSVRAIPITVALNNHGQLTRRA
jgi:glucose/mannose transport system permease protein